MSLSHVITTNAADKCGGYWVDSASWWDIMCTRFFSLLSCVRLYCSENIAVNRMHRLMLIFSLLSCVRLYCCENIAVNRMHRLMLAFSLLSCVQLYCCENIAVNRMHRLMLAFSLLSCVRLYCCENIAVNRMHRLMLAFSLLSCVRLYCCENIAVNRMHRLMLAFSLLSCVRLYCCENIAYCWCTDWCWPSACYLVSGYIAVRILLMHRLMLALSLLSCVRLYCCENIADAQIDVGLQLAILCPAILLWEYCWCTDWCWPSACYLVSGYIAVRILLMHRLMLAFQCSRHCAMRILLMHRLMLAFQCSRHCAMQQTVITHFEDDTRKQMVEFLYVCFFGLHYSVLLLWGPCIELHACLAPWENKHLSITLWPFVHTLVLNCTL